MLAAVTLLLSRDTFLPTIDPPVSETFETLKVSERVSEVVDKEFFAEKVRAAKKYFDSFEFQAYRSFAARRVRRSTLRVAALKHFFTDLRELKSQVSSRGVALGESTALDSLSALSLVAHYISPQGQQALAVRDGFKAVSMYDLLVAGLNRDKSVSRQTRKIVAEHQELAVFFLQVRAVVAGYLALAQVYKFDVATNTVKPWTLNLSHLKDKKGDLARLQFLLETAVEARDVLASLGQSLDGLSPVKNRLAFEEVLAQMRITEEKKTPFYQLASLFAQLKRPLM